MTEEVHDCKHYVFFGDRWKENGYLSERSYGFSIGETRYESVMDFIERCPRYEEYRDMLREFTTDETIIGKIHLMDLSREVTIEEIHPLTMDRFESSRERLKRFRRETLEILNVSDTKRDPPLTRTSDRKHGKILTERRDPEEIDRHQG
jgi:hypothetical protein